MNPHRKYKNHGPHGIVLVFMFLVLLFIPFVVVVLNPTHKQNISQLKNSKPLVQQYSLNQFDKVWFCKHDEIGWTKGEVFYLWGYHPVIFSEHLNKTFEFNEVEWMVGNE